MNRERFQRLLAARRPFASVYFDDSHDMANPAADLDVRWRDVRRALEELRAEPALLSVVERAVLGVPPPVGRSGRGVVATADGVLVNERLPYPEPLAVVRLSALPFILPLVARSPAGHTYLLVAVDHLGADITVHKRGGARTEAVDAGGYPVHKASRGDRGEYGEAQQRVDEMFRRNVKAVADRITAIVDGAHAEAVFITGEVRSRTALMSALPERISQRAVAVHAGARHAVVDEQAHAAIQDQFDRLGDAMADFGAERFSAERNRESGLAVEGLGPVSAALRDGAVGTLLVGDLGESTVVADDKIQHIAPNADVLSEWGTAATRVVRADEALPFAAVSTGASIICTGTRIDLADGVGALLRYAESGDLSAGADRIAARG